MIDYKIQHETWFYITLTENVKQKIKQQIKKPIKWKTCSSTVSVNYASSQFIKINLLFIFAKSTKKKKELSNPDE